MHSGKCLQSLNSFWMFWQLSQTIEIFKTKLLDCMCNLTSGLMTTHPSTPLQSCSERLSLFIYVRPNQLCWVLTQIWCKAGNLEIQQQNLWRLHIILGTVLGEQKYLVKHNMQVNMLGNMYFNTPDNMLGKMQGNTLGNMLGKMHVNTLGNMLDKKVGNWMIG